MQKRLSKSQRKYIRFQKARIRREVSNSEKQKQAIEELYKKFEKADKKKRISKKETINTIENKSKTKNVPSKKK